MRMLVSLRCHAPRMRGIQYAEASRLKHERLWNTGSPGHPRSSRGQAPGDDTGESGCLKIESRGRAVLDTPHARGMTSCGGGARLPVIASEAKQSRSQVEARRGTLDCFASLAMTEVLRRR